MKFLGKLVSAEVIILILILILIGFSGCVSEYHHLRNKTVDNIVTRAPLPPPPPDTACITLPRFRVVSLKQLQQVAHTNHLQKETDDFLLNMCHLKSVEGFLMDRKGSDLLIFGNVDAAMPPLMLDDFIVALRCAWKKYVVNNMFTPPGCSIDPSPQMLKRMDEVENRITAARSPSRWKKYQKDFEQVCAEPQSVRVLGMPFNTHFASVLVKADYDMKRLVDGSDSVDIPGVVDLYSLASYDMRQAMLADEKIQETGSTLSRFWFVPAQMSFVKQQNLIMLDRCEISLLTEEQHVTDDNKIIDKGRKDPHAEKVAGSITTYYRYIAQQRPIFRQLKELMRLYIVLEAMYNQDAQRRSGIDLSYFLNTYRLPQYPVTATLPGRSRYEIENYENQTMDQIQQFTLVFPLCGGVAFEVFLQDHHFIQDKDQRLAGVSRAIISQKPEAGALFWDVVLANAGLR